jgi:hypothetical protein
VSRPLGGRVRLPRQKRHSAGFASGHRLLWVVGDARAVNALEFLRHADRDQRCFYLVARCLHAHPMPTRVDRDGLGWVVDRPAIDADLHHGGAVIVSALHEHDRARGAFATDASCCCLTALASPVWPSSVLVTRGGSNWRKACRIPGSAPGASHAFAARPPGRLRSRVPPAASATPLQGRKKRGADEPRRCAELTDQQGDGCERRCERHLLQSGAQGGLDQIERSRNAAREDERIEIENVLDT